MEINDISSIYSCCTNCLLMLITRSLCKNLTYSTAVCQQQSELQPRFDAATVSHYHGLVISDQWAKTPVSQMQCDMSAAACQHQSASIIIS